jgi:hypothetical protein
MAAVGDSFTHLSGIVDISAQVGQLSGQMAGRNQAGWGFQDNAKNLAHALAAFGRKVKILALRREWAEATGSSGWQKNRKTA